MYAILGINANINNVLFDSLHTGIICQQKSVITNLPDLQIDLCLQDAAT